MSLTEGVNGDSAARDTNLLSGFNPREDNICTASHSSNTVVTARVIRSVASVSCYTIVTPVVVW